METEPFAPQANKTKAELQDELERTKQRLRELEEENANRPVLVPQPVESSVPQYADESIGRADGRLFEVGVIAQVRNARELPTLRVRAVEVSDAKSIYFRFFGVQETHKYNLRCIPVDESEPVAAP